MPKSSDGIFIFDDFLKNPEDYRAFALRQEYRTYEFPEATFQSIALAGHSPWLEQLQNLFPGIIPTLTFFRKSPLGQLEPHFIHTDIDMGDWSAILYLNPKPPEDDGTSFWTHNESGMVESFVPHERSQEGKNTEGWTLRRTVESRFNRLLVFPSSYFHSRAIYNNWTEGAESRLTQIVFGRGSIA